MHHQSRRLPNRHEPAGHAVHNSASLRPSIRLTVIATGVCVAVARHALASERRSRAVARELQREHLCPSTGLTSGAGPGYRRDHIVPLACGGPDAVSNMQWQTVAEARAKEAWERQACVR